MSSHISEKDLESLSQICCDIEKRKDDLLDTYQHLVDRSIKLNKKLLASQNEQHNIWSGGLDILSVDSSITEEKIALSTVEPDSDSFSGEILIRIRNAGWIIQNVFKDNLFSLRCFCSDAAVEVSSDDKYIITEEGIALLDDKDPSDIALEISQLEGDLSQLMHDFLKFSDYCLDMRSPWVFW